MTSTDGVPKRISRDPSSWPKWMHSSASRRTQCRDCGVGLGVAHRLRCEDAICLWTGENRSSCASGLANRVRRILQAHGQMDLAAELCAFLALDDVKHDCGLDAWDGTFPGERDIAALGWFTRWTARGWEKCTEDDEFAQPDLNRIVPECRWDRSQARWVPRKTGESP